MAESIVYKKAYEFALKIIEIFKSLEKKNINDLSRQLLRSGTSIGANLAEANGSLTKKEFSAKVSIAYKEVLETRYWLALLNDSKYLTSVDFENLDKDAVELCKILFSILKSTERIKQKQN
jgi:four helix bundle protein